MTFFFQIFYIRQILFRSCIHLFLNVLIIFLLNFQSLLIHIISIRTNIHIMYLYPYLYLILRKILILIRFYIDLIKNSSFLISRYFYFLSVLRYNFLIKIKTSNKFYCIYCYICKYQSDSILLFIILMKSQHIIKSSPNKQIIDKVNFIPVQKTKVTVVKKSPLEETYQSASKQKGQHVDNMKLDKKTHIFYGKKIEPLNIQDDEKKNNERLYQNIIYSNMKKISLRNERLEEKKLNNKQHKQNFSDINHQNKKKQNPPDIRIAITFEKDEQNIPIPNDQKILLRKSGRNQDIQKIAVREKESTDEKNEIQSFEINKNPQTMIQEQLKSSFSISLDQQIIILNQHKNRRISLANKNNRLNIKNKKLDDAIPQFDTNHMVEKSSIILNQIQFQQSDQKSQQFLKKQQVNPNQENQSLNLVQQQYSIDDFNKRKAKELQSNNTESQKGSRLLQVEVRHYPRCLPQLYCKHH